MAEIRLSKLTRQFNIGLGTLIEFLNEKGAGISSNDPNFKVSDEFLPVLQAKFGGDQAMKQDSEKVATKLKEMIDSSKKKNPTAEEEDPAEKEILIKTNVINSQSDKPAVKAAEPVVEPEVAQPEPEAVEPEPGEEPEPEVVEPLAEPESVVEPEPVVEAEPETPVADEPEEDEGVSEREEEPQTV